MKKIVIALLLVALFAAGCSRQETMETVGDVLVQQTAAPMQQVVVDLPKEAALPTMETEDGKLYLCENYTISQQIMESGDLERTVRAVSGYSREDLKVMETAWEKVKRYDFVWTAAGETEDQVCRACILDDGSYHYVLTAFADASQAGQLQDTWREMFNSFRLISPEISTGS